MTLGSPTGWLKTQPQTDVAGLIDRLRPPASDELPTWFQGYDEGLRVAAAVIRAHQRSEQ